MKKHSEKITEVINDYLAQMTQERVSYSEMGMTISTLLSYAHFLSKCIVYAAKDKPDELKELFINQIRKIALKNSEVLFE